MSIYQRQETLEYDTDQTFLVCGAGGVGFHVVKMLAMAGVKRIVCFDPDELEEHNLNRLEYTINDIGEKKAVLLEKYVKNIRPDCDIDCYPFKFKEHLVDEYFDWFIDCTDDFPSQQKHEKIAKGFDWDYCKPGYNGESITLSNKIPTWVIDDGRSGYTITPSFVAPATIVAALTVTKVLKYKDKEFSTNVVDLYSN